MLENAIIDMYLDAYPKINGMDINWTVNQINLACNQTILNDTILTEFFNYLFQKENEINENEELTIYNANFCDLVLIILMDEELEFSKGTWQVIEYSLKDVYIFYSSPDR